MNEPIQLITKESPRQIIFEDFKIDLPISGGWGYSIESACVIDKNDSIVSKVLPFNGIGIEYIFVEKRIYEEMIIFRGANEKFAGIRWDRKTQEVFAEGGKTFEKLVFNVIGFSDQDWDKLTSRFEEIQKNGKVELMSELNAHRESMAHRFIREFYFDISSFYGQ